MKRLLVTSGFVFMIALLSAQNREMAIPGKNGLVLIHSITAKETLYSISRSYNVKISQLIELNGFTKDKTFSVGDKVKIPLVADNFNQQNSKGTPVYYEVGEKEGLMTVSNKFNKVLLKNLREWNGLKSDQLAKGKLVIVGYTKTTPVKDNAPVVKAETVKPEAKTDAAKPKTKPTIKTEAPKRAKEIAENNEPLVATPPAEQPVKNKLDEIEGNGYFKKIYVAQTDPSLTTKKYVNSGIFKTNIGWGDQKYYLLADGVATGTIIKVVNPLNNAIIYAKVLGPMQGLKQNAGFDIRISDAAASVLKIGNAEKFQLNIIY